ncbi:hypothetical protein BDQ17DRAFT_803217 [Cyathus striatus]|nr:hypothetical protein BDQ17DRAFT_803217 [Cyathus striatus]
MHHSSYLLGSGLCQMTILGLTVIKFILVRRGMRRTPLAWAMAREFGVFVLLLAIIVAMVTYEILQSFGIIFWDAAYSWYLAIMSITGCRLLLGMGEVSLLQFHRNEEMTADIDLDEMQSSCPTANSYVQ